MDWPRWLRMLDPAKSQGVLFGLKRWPESSLVTHWEMLSSCRWPVLLVQMSVTLIGGPSGWMTFRSVPSHLNDAGEPGWRPVRRRAAWMSDGRASVMTSDSCSLVSGVQATSSR